MKKLLSLFILLFISVSAVGQPLMGVEVIKQMHRKYHQAPCKSYTFSQKNTHYRNDSVIGNSEWYESVEFPDKFLIQIGKKKDGNYKLRRNDSIYRYKENKLVKSGTDSSSLLLLIGGMYYRDLNDVASRLQAAGYDFNKLHENKWNGTDVYVIGAENGQLDVNQFWVDKKTLVVLRIIEKMKSAEMLDMRFDAHQKMCNGFIETKVSFLRNGKLEQVEEYFDIKKTKGFPKN